MSAATPVENDFQALQTTFARRWFAVFVRMLWKEFRVIRPFLLVVAATMGGLAALVIWVCRDQLQDAWGPLYAIVILFPLLFALGCGGMSFAGEREDGTWDWLRRIAAPPSAVCAAKIVVGMLCAVGLAMAAWLALSQFAWRPELARSAVDASHRRLIVLVIGVSITLLICQIVSSLIKNVFVVLIVSAVVLAPLMTVGLALGTDHTGAYFGMEFSAASFALSVIGSVASVLGLIVCEFSLADCWLKDVAPWRGGLIGMLINPINRQRLLLSAIGHRQNPLSHLISREWALARPWVWSVGLTLVIPIWLSVGTPNSWFRRGGSFVAAPLLVFATFLLALVPPMLGVWAYQPDQRDLRFRFLADRGISPTLIWLSKHLVRVPMLFLLVLTAAVLGLIWGIAQGIGRGPIDGAEVAWFLATLLAVTVMNYSAGQLMGQLIRSPITSSFLAVVFSLLLALWTLSLRMLHVSFVFDLVPIVILFAASWLRSRDWLLERTTWRARLQLAASLIVPFALLYGAVGWYRLSGLPRVARNEPILSEATTAHLKQVEAQRELEQQLKQINEIYREEFEAMSSELESLANKLAPTATGIFNEQMPRPVTREEHRQIREGVFRQEAEDEQRVHDIVAKLFPFLDAEEVTREARRFHHELAPGLKSWRDVNRHPTHLGELLREPISVPRSLATVFIRDLHCRHFPQTFQQLVQVSERLRQGDVLPFWTGPRSQIPVELLLLKAEKLVEQGDSDHALPLLWAAEILRLGHWLGESKLSITNDRSFDHHVIKQRFLTAAALCRKSEPLRPNFGKSNQMPESLEVVKQQLNWNWAAVNDPSDDARLLAGQGHSELRGWMLPASSNAPILMRLFPWELSLVRRESTVYFARELAVAEAINEVIHDRAVDRIVWTASSVSDPLKRAERSLPAVAEFDRPIRPNALLTVIPAEYSQQIELTPQSRSEPISWELERRQVVLLLALIAWHHEHGELPESLDQLVGPYLDKLPLDPLTGKAFVFQKSPKPSVLPPCVLEKRVPQLRVRSLDNTHDEWLELRVEFTPYELPKELFTKPEAEK